MVFGLSYLDLLVRLAAALLAGLLVGTERESHGRAAGLRTTVLVSVAACLAMIISASLFNLTVSNGAPNRPDPARLAAGVLSGMGFLGAGSIIRNGNRVQGITTAATLWFITMLGLAFGAGLYLIGGLGMLIALVVLFVLPPIERQVKNDWYATLTVQSSLDGLTDDEVRCQIETLGLKIKKIDLSYDLQSGHKVLRCELKFKKDKVFALASRVVQHMIQQRGVLHVSWD